MVPEAAPEPPAPGPQPGGAGGVTPELRNLKKPDDVEVVAAPEAGPNPDAGGPEPGATPGPREAAGLGGRPPLPPVWATPPAASAGPVPTPPPAGPEAVAEAVWGQPSRLENLVTGMRPDFVAIAEPNSVVPMVFVPTNWSIHDAEVIGQPPTRMRAFSPPATTTPS